MLRPHSFLRLVLFLFTLVFVSAIAKADTSATVKQVVELESKSEEISQQADLEKETIRVGSTPLSTLMAIQDAMQDNDISAAAQFMDMRYLPKDLTEEGAESLLRKLGIIWRQQKLIDLSNISHEESGFLDDGLPSYRDLIGKLEYSGGKIPVYLQKIPDKEHGHVWKISNHTIHKIPTLWAEFGYPDWIQSLSDTLPKFELFYMNNWQVIGFVIILIFSWYLSRLFTFMLRAAVKQLRPDMQPMQDFITGALRYALYFLFITFGISQLGLSIQAKIWLDSGILTYIAAIFFTLGLLELMSQRIEKRLDKNAFSRSIIRPLTTTVKILAVIILILSWLNDAGYNLTTVLTGLGIGSLAIALAAQKTLENVFGAFTLYIARPIKPGDFCQFGTIMGTVEEIGLRSTRIRKLDRSIVHVPNSVFSSKELENFAEIDRRLYKRELRLRLDTSPDQLRLILIELRKLIFSHPEILTDGARVRFESIERDAYLVVINAYINTANLLEFKEIAEDLNFRTLDILHALEIQLSVPQQHIVMTQEAPQSDAAKQAAQQEVQHMIEKGELPFPNFSQAERDAMDNQLTYPPLGSVANHTEKDK